MSKTRLGALGALLLFVAPLLFSAEVKNGTFAYNYDVDSASLTYVRLVGQNGDPFGGSIAGPGTIKTVGSSTTVTENVASTNPFRDVGVGDVIQVSTSTNARFTRVVVAKASDASITVDSAVDLSAGYAWRWWDSQIGTTINDGWIDVSSYSSAAMTVQYEQGDLDALTVRWECRTASLGAQPVIVYPGESSDCGIGGTLVTDRCSFATAGVTARLAVEVLDNPFAACRVGLAFAATDTSDAGAALEQVIVTLTVVKPASGQ
jgi:hypothetical protein